MSKEEKRLKKGYGGGYAPRVFQRFKSQSQQRSHQTERKIYEREATCSITDFPDEILTKLFDELLNINLDESLGHTQEEISIAIANEVLPAGLSVQDIIRIVSEAEIIEEED